MSSPISSLKLKMTRAGIKGVLTPPVEAETEADTEEQFETPDAVEDAPEDQLITLGAEAHLAATYASVLGAKVLGRDMGQAIACVDAGVARGEAPATLRILAQAMAKLGMRTAIGKITDPQPGNWPALARMTNGQLVLVLAQAGGEVTLYERGSTDNRTIVPLTEFMPVFTGEVLRAEVSLDHIAKSHGTAEKPAHWFWGEFPRFRRFIGEITLGSLVANLLAVAVALFSLQIYDRVIPHQSHATLWVLAIGVSLAIVLEALLKLARSRLMDGGGRAVELNVQRLLMRRIIGMRSDKRPQSPSELFATTREFGAVREFFTASTIGTLTDLPFIVLFLALVASIAGNVVWVLVAGGLLMVIPGLLFQKKMMRLSRETQGASVKSSRLLHEAIYELDTVKTTRGEDRVMRLWDELNTVSSLKSSEQRRLAAILTFWSQGVQQATYVAAVVMGTFLVFAGEFTVGTIIATGILTGRTLAPLSQLAGTLARWSNVKTALDGLDHVVAAEQELDEARTYLRRDKLEGTFELRDMGFTYPDQDRATLDIGGVKLMAGQRIAVLGANGSGKSTLLRILSGLYAPTQGRVMLDGVEIGQLDPRDIRRAIGYLGQDVRLFAGTLRDNLNLHMLEQDDARMMQALTFAGLDAYVAEHPKGLDLDIMDGGAGLSVGQRQSIGWARIWLQDPAIVLLDEPTASLDQQLEAALVARLDSWLEGRTAVIATHRQPIVSLTERVLILQKGRLAVDGPRAQVLEHLQKSKTVAAAPVAAPAQPPADVYA